MTAKPTGDRRALAVFTIPSHRSFADALAAGIISRFGADPLALASGRVLLPNNRAVRTVTEAFVRASGSGLLLPRLIPIGDPDLSERIGGALDAADGDEPVAPAVDPLERLLALAKIVQGPGDSAAEAVRLASDLARTLDALLIEEVSPARLRDAAADAGRELAHHWQVSLAKLQAIVEHWPGILAQRGAVDLAERRNRLLRGTAERWSRSPPAGFTVAAGITTAAPAVAALLRVIARMASGMVVIPGLGLADSMPDDEWEALGPDDRGRREETHPQYHLKLLLDRIGVARGEVKAWPAAGRASSSPERARAVALAMTAADFSHKWQSAKRSSASFAGIRLAELPDTASEAQAIALALREALETPGRTAALVTPDRELATRVSALLSRWGIEADDSAGTPLSKTAAGTLLLAISSAAAEDLAPVALLALLKHPLVGGRGQDRLEWLDEVRLIDLALRGPRPAVGLDGLDRHFAGQETERRCRGCLAAWQRIRPSIAGLAGLLAKPIALPEFVEALSRAAEAMAGDSAWRGAGGRLAAEILADLQAVRGAQELAVGAADAVPLLRQLLDRQSVRPPYGGHPRIFIWGLLEARLQQADLMILAGLNEGSWPGVPAPDPWLAPRIRKNLGLPGLDYRIGLSAHDFAGALGAPEVLITRARRDARSATVGSRFLLRLQAVSAGLQSDEQLPALVAALDDPGEARPADRPMPAPPADMRPRVISVTAVDRLKADPYAFYAQAMLGLYVLDQVDSDHTAAWKGTAVHKVLEQWLKEDECDPDRLMPRARELLSGEAVHPLLRALWQPRLLEAIEWIATLERDHQGAGRRPLAAEAFGKTEIAGVTLKGRADRIDRLPDGRIAIIDYKTGSPPSNKAVEAGFALQLGLLGLIARAGGFGESSGEPGAHEYWSLNRNGDSFGKCSKPDHKLGAEAFLERAAEDFEKAAGTWLTGTEPFKAKLNPAYSPWTDYDQLMRLEEWYGRE